MTLLEQLNTSITGSVMTPHHKSCDFPPDLLAHVHGYLPANHHKITTYTTSITSSSTSLLGQTSKVSDEKSIQFTQVN